MELDFKFRVKNPFESQISSNNEFKRQVLQEALTIHCHLWKFSVSGNILSAYIHKGLTYQNKLRRLKPVQCWIYASVQITKRFYICMSI